MSEQVEDRSFSESHTSGLEEFPAFKLTNNSYTRAFLLEFCDAKVCGRLPPDFDLSTLRELDGASVDKVEGKKTSSNPSLCGPFPSNRWNSDLPGERWDCRSFVLSKGSRSQVTCFSEKRGTTSQPLLGQSGYNTGFLVPESQITDLFQLRKSCNPYRPPHCLKIDDNAKFDSNASLVETNLAKTKGPFLEKFQSVTIEQCENNAIDVSVLDEAEACVDQENSIGGYDANQIMGRTCCVIDFSNRFSTASSNPPNIHLQINSGGLTNLIEKTPELFDSCSEHGMENLVKPCFSAVENNQGDSVHCTTEDDFEYEFPFSDVEIYLNSILGECEASLIHKGGRDYVESGIIKDSECTSDDEWAEISQILQLERDYDPIPNSNAEINLPDEDTLITVDDFIFPPFSTFSVNYNLLEDDSVTSNLAAKITNNPEALNFSAKSFNVQPLLDIPGLVTCGKLHLQSQSHDILHSKMPFLHPGNDRVNNLNTFTTPTITRYLPPSLCYSTFSNTDPSFHGTTLTKPKAIDSLVHYSLLQKPCICSQQQNQTLVHPAWTDPIKKAVGPDMKTMQLIPWTSSDKAICQDFRKSHSDVFGDQKAYRMLNADKFSRGIYIQEHNQAVEYH